VPVKPPKLNGALLRRLHRSIAGADPTQLWFEFALRTREMTRELIRREFGCACRRPTRGACCADWGPYPQRPLRQAWQARPGRHLRWQAKELLPSAPTYVLGLHARCFLSLSVRLSTRSKRIVKPVSTSEPDSLRMTTPTPPP
jgi:hypothetical protein